MVRKKTGHTILTHSLIPKSAYSIDEPEPVEGIARIKWVTIESAITHFQFRNNHHFRMTNANQITS